MVMAFGDDLHKEKYSVATYSIALLCSIMTLLVPDFSKLGFIPVNFSLHPAISLYTLVTAQFLHVGSLHLLGNLFFLVAFGRSLETLIGPLRFAFALIGLGAFSFLGSWILSPASTVPIVGISGSLSLLLGAYTVIFPRAKIRILPFLRVLWLRAWVFSCLWLGMQLRDMFLLGEDQSQIAYATHIAGFIIGLVAGAVWREMALDTDRLIAKVYSKDK
jgi:membrane associated rhomboid family serine protease